MLKPAHDTHAIVSSDSDLLILVNQDDEEIGTADKLACHDGEGVLHRAFSVLLFNSKGELLLQKRAPGKRLWGGFWSNSCCSHPRQGERMENASRRRVREELGLEAELEYLYKFEYHAQFGASGAEHELCWVYIGRCDDTPSVNINEISEWKYCSAQSLSTELNQNAQAYTPWLKLEWDYLLANHAAQLRALGVNV